MRLSKSYLWTVSVGDPNESQKQFLPWDQFVRKYLEEASPGVARVLTAVAGKGALPPGTGGPPLTMTLRELDR